MKRIVSLFLVIIVLLLPVGLAESDSLFPGDWYMLDTAEGTELFSVAALPVRVSFKEDGSVSIDLQTNEVTTYAGTWSLSEAGADINVDGHTLTATVNGERLEMSDGHDAFVLTHEEPKLDPTRLGAWYPTGSSRLPVYSMELDPDGTLNFYATRDMKEALLTGTWEAFHFGVSMVVNGQPGFMTIKDSLLMLTDGSDIYTFTQEAP